MRLTTKSQYAVRALLHLTEKEGKTIQMREISVSEGISKPYIEQLFNKMRKYGLIKSIRGPQGGYILARPAKKITMGDIVRSVEGPIHLTRCAGEKDSFCKRSKLCRSFPMWSKVNKKIEAVLDSVSLGDLI